MWSSVLIVAGIVLPLALFYRLARKVRAIRTRSEAGLQCPTCRSKTAWKSKPRFVDGIYAVFFCHAYRCGSCGGRSYFWNSPD